jgi:hypothetical protein
MNSAMAMDARVDDIDRSAPPVRRRKLSYHKYGTATLLACTLLLLWAAPAVALDDSAVCTARKLKSSGKYLFCRMKAEAKSVSKNLPPDSSACEAKLASQFAAIESSAGGACAMEGDGGTVQSIGTADTGFMAKTVSLSPRFTNNGNGTISDADTGLTWEIKSYFDASIHDVAKRYSWADASAVHVAALNAATFGGYDDWRVPSVNELVSLFNYNATDLVKGFPEFDENCTPGGDPFYSCTVLECSCAFSESYGADDYWTSQSNPSDASEAFTVRNWNFEIDPTWSKVGEHTVIAVRGGRGG